MLVAIRFCFVPLIAAHPAAIVLHGDMEGAGASYVLPDRPQADSQAPAGSIRAFALISPA